METRKIGSLDVSVVGLGCNNFGGRIDEAATKSVIDAAIDAGITLFDTADIYGGTRSEEFMGNLLGARRSKIVLATKFGMKVADGLEGAKPAYIRRAVEDSLRRLKTDVIDLYQLHRPDPETPIADTLATLNDLVKEGKVREIGASNFSIDQMREAKAAAGAGARFVSIQNEYSLFKREPENGVLAECEAENVGFLPYFPLASGLLTGKYRKGQPLPEGTRIKEGSDWLTPDKLDVVEDLIAFARSKDHTILELAISWLLAQPAVSSVIAGATKPSQIEANTASAGWKLSAEDLKAIDGILTREHAAV